MTLISILGPTSSGKSDLAVDLALEFERVHGLGSAVIISCDSRQVYRDLNLGTGKVEGSWQDYKLGNSTQKVFLYRNIPHFLIDFVDLNVRYSLHDYILDYLNLFQVWKSIDFNPKYVILCGGTGLFAKAVADEYALNTIELKYESQIEALKINLNQKNVAELQSELALFNPDFKTQLNNSDQNNPRRLINLLLKYLAQENGWNTDQKLSFPKFENKFAFYLNPKNLPDRLAHRLKLRFEQGLIEEVEELLKNRKLTSEKLLELGLEYKEFWFYFIGLQALEEFKQNAYRQNWQYIRRQLVWFKKQSDLIPVSNLSEILKMI